MENRNENNSSNQSNNRSSNTTSNNNTNTGNTSNRGFASMDEDKQREIASKGGKSVSQEDHVKAGEQSHKNN